MLPSGTILLERGPEGASVIVAADTSVAMSALLLDQVTAPGGPGERDGSLLTICGVDTDGNPRQVVYRLAGFEPTTCPEAHEGGFHLLERIDRTPMIPTEPVDLARIAYRAYGETTHHTNVRGEPMPDFDDLGPLIQTAWTNAALAVADTAREAP